MNYPSNRSVELLLIVKAEDMEFIVSYLAQENYPPISVEAAGYRTSSQRPPPGSFSVISI